MYLPSSLVAELSLQESPFLNPVLGEMIDKHLQKVIERRYSSISIQIQPFQYSVPVVLDISYNFRFLMSYQYSTNEIDESSYVPVVAQILVEKGETQKIDFAYLCTENRDSEYLFISLCAFRFSVQ
jgi:hypothetical protein